MCVKIIEMGPPSLHTELTAVWLFGLTEETLLLSFKVKTKILPKSREKYIETGIIRQTHRWDARTQCNFDGFAQMYPLVPQGTLNEKCVVFLT